MDRGRILIQALLSLGLCSQWSRKTPSKEVAAALKVGETGDRTHALGGYKMRSCRIEGFPMESPSPVSVVE